MRVISTVLISSIYNDYILPKVEGITYAYIYIYIIYIIQQRDKRDFPHLIGIIGNPIFRPGHLKGKAVKVKISSQRSCG